MVKGKRIGHIETNHLFLDKHRSGHLFNRFFELTDPPVAE